ncbi:MULTISPECIES: LysR family transcriptional regulator [Pandoraea]|uniref:LysR family transcriptional regulator n=1 Tax=Pandoraea communis TaxID=2508297 RepID=A0A5E4XUD8_9BURK|nr:MULTISPECIES: LysR family transcriptional regulator [Pandoraea]ALS66636.1 LysR family transcriptional regulator [Pandoraea apista]CFB61381.1 HTH-type transcriptional regulator SyrM 1 [Pandoraea apista]VVE39946.1 LysR family transcriptional regulator [Pandoraea communis]
MKQVNMTTVDLNLLRTFLAIWEGRSLTVAADKLHVSQPAISHALRRLREVFDDPLFVRSSLSMEPTPAATRLHLPIQEAFTIIHGALVRHAGFEPATASRTFRLAMSDMAQLHVLPALMQVLATRAPNVEVQVQQLPVDLITTALRKGDIDLALGYLAEPGHECRFDKLREDEFVCMLRAEHPFRASELTIEDVNRLRFVHSCTNTTGHNSVMEVAFRQAGIQQSIALQVPQFTIAPQVVAMTDLAFILPHPIAEQVNRDGIYRLLRLPLTLPTITVGLYSHDQFSEDDGIAWLRSVLIELFSSNSESPW